MIQKKLFCERKTLFIFIVTDAQRRLIAALVIYPSPFAEASLHFLIAYKLGGKNLPVVPSRESNWGLLSSKPTRYQLSHAAPQF
jgi:hypothetical protein